MSLLILHTSDIWVTQKCPTQREHKQSNSTGLTQYLRWIKKPSVFDGSAQFVIRFTNITNKTFWDNLLKDASLDYISHNSDIWRNFRLRTFLNTPRTARKVTRNQFIFNLKDTTHQRSDPLTLFTL